MQNNNKKTVAIVIAALVVVAVIIGAYYAGKASVQNGQLSAGTPGSNYIENYDPAIKYNGGISSALPIQTTDTVTTVGLTVSGAASLTSTFAIGTNGSLIKQIQFGTTTLIGSGANWYQITASSTKNFDIAVTGLTSADLVDAFFEPTSTAANWVQGQIGFVGGGLSIVSAKASSTAGFATLTIYNGTGATYTISSDIASTTAYQVFRK